MYLFLILNRKISDAEGIYIVFRFSSLCTDKIISCWDKNPTIAQQSWDD